MEYIRHPRPKASTRSAAEFTKGILSECPEKMEEMRELSAALGLENVECPDYISKYAISQCGRYWFVASESGFLVADAQTQQVLAEHPEPYGVQNFVQLSADVLALSTWNGVKLYQITED